MKKITLLIAVCLLVAGSVSAGNIFGLFDKDRVEGSGDLITQKRNLDDFSRIKSYGSFDIFVTVGDKTSLSITFDDNLVDLITTEVAGKTLRIDHDGSFSSRKNCRIEITVPSLESVYLSGSGDVEVYNLNSDIFEMAISGSGDMKAEGKVNELELSISGSGDIDTRHLEADEVYAKVSGSGDMKIFARTSFSGKISGSGDITYYGDPEHVSSRVSGSGSIKRR